MIDIHTHLLPGLDDGPENEEEALEVISQAAAGGATCLVATPHYLEGAYQPEPQAIREAVIGINARAAQAGIQIQIVPGMEVMISPAVPRWVRHGQVLTLNENGRYLLLEFPSQEIPIYVKEVVFELQLLGVTPVLAHPERNLEVIAHPGRLADLVQRGVLVQLNADSLLGRWGERAQNCARKLLDTNLAHLVASDVHGRRRSWQLASAGLLLEEWLGAGTASLFLEQRPAALLAGAHMALPEPVVERRRRRPWWRRS